MIEKAKRNYYNDLVLDNKNNSNKLWKIIHSLSNIKTKGQSPEKLHNGDSNVLLNDLDISNKLNSFFATIGKKIAKENKPFNLSQKAQSVSLSTNVKDSLFSIQLFQERLKISLLRFKLTKPTDF